MPSIRHEGSIPEHQDRVSAAKLHIKASAARSGYHTSLQGEICQVDDDARGEQD